MRIDAPPNTDDISVFRDWIYRMWEKINEDHLYGSATWDAAEIAVGAMEAKNVTVTGAILGDHAVASLSIDLTDLTLDAQVTAADTVTCVLSNNTAAAVNLGSATVYVRVFRKVS